MTTNPVEERKFPNLAVETTTNDAHYVREQTMGMSK